VDTLKALFAAGIDVNTPDRDGVTPLMHAVHAQRRDSIQFLLPLSNLAAVDALGQNILHDVCMRSLLFLFVYPPFVFLSCIFCY